MVQMARNSVHLFKTREGLKCLQCLSISSLCPFLKDYKYKYTSVIVLAIVLTLYTSLTGTRARYNLASFQF